MDICVFGASSEKINREFITATEKLGEELAKRGHSLIFGAGLEGLMGAVARGFTKGNGKTIGIVPEFFKNEDISELYQCDEMIYTESMRERKFLMEERAESFIIVPGGIGTFEELFEVMTLRQLGRHNKKIIIFNIKNYYDKFDEFMDYSMNEGFFNSDTKNLYQLCNSVEDVIKAVEEETPDELSALQIHRH